MGDNDIGTSPDYLLIPPRWRDISEEYAGSKVFCFCADEATVVLSWSEVYGKQEWNYMIPGILPVPHPTGIRSYDDLVVAQQVALRRAQELLVTSTGHIYREISRLSGDSETTNKVSYYETLLKNAERKDEYTAWLENQLYGGVPKSKCRFCGSSPKKHSVEIGSFVCSNNWCKIAGVLFTATEWDSGGLR